MDPGAAGNPNGRHPGGGNRHQGCGAVDCIVVRQSTRCVSDDPRYE
ncbi:hypothetical protein [Myxococcus sp. AB056]|nr:hypothetical protein [Myxococcus sp. AB056]